MTYQEDDEVVISGIGGRFPEAGNVAELAEKLYAGENLVTYDSRKLTKGFYESIPDCNGKIQGDTFRFDNTFFGILPIVSVAMDPLTCQILQRTFEAVIDAGINPSEIRGSNSSVFSGTCHSDSDLEWATDTRSGYGIMGRNRCMNSNRVSYWLDLNGTSVSTDSGWTNGISNLYNGWKAIKSGKCDTAIVSTASIQCHALITFQFKDFGFLSPDGFSRCFDDSGDYFANGFGRSSAIVVFVLQRASCARRSYATIGHVLSACIGNQDRIVNKPCQKDWEMLFSEFYRESKIDVNDVNYIEAHGSALKEEDAEELNAITEFFCKDRKTPLLVGCVKSNIGHTEASSSFCGIVKSIISFENKLIPQNLHYKNPNSLCPGLAKGQLKVVQENTPLPEGWIGINCHGFGGTYGHIVLKSTSKTKTLKYDNIPRLVLLADRTNDYMDDLLEKVENTPFDLEFIGLLHQVHSKRVEKYLARGYTILPKPEKPVHEHAVYGAEKRPLWFIFSGMGSQWPKMGKRLMDLPLFRESIEKSHKLLQTKGLDLINIITTDDPKIFDNILHSFVGIAAIQVALIDVMKALKVTPDGYIGHSVGELGCAYADDCFTAEEMVLAAYYRGRASLESDLIKGSMAAVGKGYNSIKDELPDGIEVACHNSEDSCTLSGPIDLIHKFVAELKEKGVFARAVNVSNIAYHSQYIRPAAPKLLAYLKEVVKTPKLRSSKWISTSNPESKWDTDVAKYCSPEYHTNNLLSSVLFEEGSKHIPKDAICVEIAPHGLLQAIVKRSLGENVTNIALTNRTTEDPLIFLLQAIGKMYMAGVDIEIVNLYPKIEYPVSRGTPYLHSFIHWHEQNLATVVTPMEKKIVYSFKERLVKTADDGTGYIINNQNVYPMALFVQIAWDLYASFQKKETEECPVVFEDFRLERSFAVHLSEDDNITITFEIGSGTFEITTEDQILASGRISLLKEKGLGEETQEDFETDLEKDEIYDEIRRRGFDIGEHFRKLTAVTFRQGELIGKIPLSSNWVQSIETLIQLFILASKPSVDVLTYPYAFQRLEISAIEHKQYRNSVQDFRVVYNSITNTAKCGGIELRNLKSIEIPREKSKLRFPSYNFFPLMNPPVNSGLRFAEFCFSLVLDNMGATKNLTVIDVMEVSEENQTSSLGLHLQKRFSDFKVKLKTVANPDTEVKTPIEFVITSLNSLEKCLSHLKDDGFVFSKTRKGSLIPSGFNIVGRFQENPDEVYLLLKKDKSPQENREFIMFDAKQSSLKDLKISDKVIYVVCRTEPPEGIPVYKNRLQKETPVKLRWIFIIDPKAPPFDSKNPFYAEQLSKGLTTNVYKNGIWGGYYDFDFSESALLEDVNFSLEWSEGLAPSYVACDLDKNLLKLQTVEYSGKIKNKTVMGISELLNNKKIVWDKYLTWELPDSWSLEDAATCPLSYALAYYCLVILGKTKPNHKVLVTDGMTCIGRAAVAVALTVSNRVLVTVNNEKEVGLIRKLFPRLKENDVVTHEDSKFDETLKFKEKESPAQVIINLLEGERFFSMLHCISLFGRIFHFGKQEAEKNAQLGSAIFLKSLAFHTITPETITELPEDDKEQLFALVSDGIKNGVVKPLPKLAVTFNEFKELQSKATGPQNYMKTIVAVNSIKSPYVRFDTKSSYIIIAEKTDVWIDVAEWLIDRNVQNIIISCNDNSKRSHLRMPHIKKQKNVLVFNHQDVPTLLKEAQKLGPVSAVYYIQLDSKNMRKNVEALDKSYRIEGSHLLAITRNSGSTSELWKTRNDSGFPSTNFVWDADEMFINEHLEFMGKLCGRDSVIHVSPHTTLSKSDRKLIDLLPLTIDDFCDLGASLSDTVEIIPLPTLSGLNGNPYVEISPLIIISGLQKDPVTFLEPIVSNFLYPVACVKIPDIKLPISKMASFILPEIVKFNKGKVFNIVGISWGTHVAMELAKLLEEMGSSVGVILIEGPFLNSKSLVTKSLGSDILNLIQACSKSSLNMKVYTEEVTEANWRGELNKTLNFLNLPPEKEKDFCRGATYVFNNLQALLEQDPSNMNVKGPLTVIIRGEHSFDDKVIWKLSRSISIRSLPANNGDFYSSRDFWQIIQGSAVAPTMNERTINQCCWPALEEYVSQKILRKLGDEFASPNVKFSFTF